MSLSNSLRAFLTVEWVHCSGGRSSSLGQLWDEIGGRKERYRGREKEKGMRVGGEDREQGDWDRGGGNREQERKEGREQERTGGERKRERDEHRALLSCCKRPSKTDRFHLAHQADASGDCSLSLPPFSLALSPSLSLSWLFWLVNYFIQHICCIDAWIIHQLHAATIISCYFYLPGSMCSAKQFKVLPARFLQRGERK